MNLHRFLGTFLIVAGLVFPALGDTIKHRSSGRQYSGKVLQQERKDGRERVLFQAEGGKSAWVWADEWEVVVSPEPRQPPTVPSDTPEPRPAGNVAEVNFGDDGPPKKDAGSPVRQVIATGIGLDPEKALQAAFTQAIEQTVGVLVDSETLIENDELIRDKVLTFSRGYVQEFAVLKRWEEGGLHKAKIRATVSVTKLVEKLKANRIAVRDVAGELMSRQLKHEVTSEQDAAEMFAEIMEDYTIEKLFKVEILGKPEVVKKTATDAELKMSLRLVGDAEQWKKIHDKLQPLLQRVATKRSSFVTRPTVVDMNQGRSIGVDRDLAEDLEHRLEGDGPLIAVLKSRNRSGGVITWNVYRVPDSSNGISNVLNRVREKTHQVRLVLLDANEQSLAEESQKLIWNRGSCHLIAMNPLYPADIDPFCLGPLFWSGSGSRSTNSKCRFVYEPCEVTIRVDLDTLGKVKTCAAYAEAIKQ